MLSTSLPSYLGGDVLTVAHLINRMPSHGLHLQTPLECLIESYPSTRLIFDVPLQVFRCTTYVHNNGLNPSKFTPQAQACVFVGYPLHQRGYKCFHPSSYKYFVSMDVTFLEDRPFSKISLPVLLLLPYQAQILITALPMNQVPWKTYYRRNLRKEIESPAKPLAPIQDSKPPRDQGMENPIESCTNNTMSENDRSDVVVLENVEEKNSDDETEVRTETSNNKAEQGHTGKLDEYDPSLDILITLRKECPKWKNAVMEEMKALEKNRTWEICALSKGHKIVGCEWVFSLTYKAYGTLDRHKA
ncbi:reverse transcriptase [Cucumis melo var. makuwa]|uniref:Reverse transcriptase n=1 Tax=Cucumis melo var. makuwa TaxID=1194695 RepID=A0A5D3CBQ5_CUCMM|nr:reverse transcriptase [Cucumis melo var. makuwa]TYK07796.1 reverse transcriptase [Cucumis melo var. makuwa]